MGFGSPLTMPSRNTLTPGCYNLRIMSVISAQSYWDASISVQRAAALCSYHHRRRSEGQDLSFAALFLVAGLWNSLPTAENHNSLFS